MINDKRLVAIIPARAGSKGIPNKNLIRIKNDTLIEWAIKLADSCPYVDKTYVSTDSMEIHELAAKYNCATPNLRPTHLANDMARTVDVIIDLCQTKVISNDDLVILLQPTSPVRSTEQLNSICCMMEKNFSDADGIVSVTQCSSPSPYKALTISNGYLKSLMGIDSTVPRQSLPASFYPNGAFYLTKVNVLINENTFIPIKTKEYLMNDEYIVNLDNIIDYRFLQLLLDNNCITEVERNIGLKLNFQN